MASDAKKISVLELQRMKHERRPAAWVTAYDFPFGQAAEQAGVDMILVGDSGGMVQLGYPTTNPVTMEEMLFMARSVRRGAPNTFVIGDMPQGAYEASDTEAVHNAIRFIKEAGCDAVKLEGGKRMADRVQAIARAGVLVMGHIGLTPQSASAFGGYRVQGKTPASFEATLDEALALQHAGAFSILLEAMPGAPAEQISRQIEIPLYGIGAGRKLDGQLIIMHDLLGFYQPFRPWFAKCYIPEILDRFATELRQSGDMKKLGRETRADGMLRLSALAIRQYVEDVRSGQFPGDEYCYPLKDDELRLLESSPRWRAELGTRS